MWDKDDNIFGCPNCGSGLVGYHCWLNRYGCLVCGWTSRECEIGNREDLVLIPNPDKKIRVQNG